MIDDPSREVDNENDNQNPKPGLDHLVQGRTFTGFYQRDPIPVYVVQILLVLEPSAPVSQIFLVERKLLERIERGFGSSFRVFTSLGGAALAESFRVLLDLVPGLLVFLDLRLELVVPLG